MVQKGTVLSVQKATGSVVVGRKETAVALHRVVSSTLYSRPIPVIAHQPVGRVVAYGMQGPPGPPGAGGEEDMAYAQRVDTVGETHIYIGDAPPGTQDTDSGWRIKKVTFTGDDADTKWAGGSGAFVNSWADRETLEYI